MAKKKRGRGLSRGQRERQGNKNALLTPELKARLHDPDELFNELLLPVNATMHTLAELIDSAGNDTRSIAAETNATSLEMARLFEKKVEYALSSSDLEVRAVALASIIVYLVNANTVVQIPPTRSVDGVLRGDNPIAKESIRHADRILQMVGEAFVGWENSSPVQAAAFFDRIAEFCAIGIAPLGTPDSEAVMGEVDVDGGHDGLDDSDLENEPMVVSPFDLSDPRIKHMILLLNISAAVQSIGVRVLHSEYMHSRYREGRPGEVIVNSPFGYRGEVLLARANDYVGLHASLDDLRYGSIAALLEQSSPSLGRVYADLTGPRLHKNIIQPAEQLATLPDDGKHATMVYDATSADGVVPALEKNIIALGPPHCYPLIKSLIVDVAKEHWKRDPLYKSDVPMPVRYCGMYGGRVMAAFDRVLTPEHQGNILKGVERNWSKLEHEGINVVTSGETYGFDASTNKARKVLLDAEGRSPVVGVAELCDQKLVEKNPFDFPELTEVQRSHLISFGERLKADVLERAVMGLRKSTTNIGNNIVFELDPNESAPAPSCAVRVVNLRAIYQLQLEESGEVLANREDPENYTSTPTDEIVEVLTWAAVHDQVVRKLSVRVREGAVIHPVDNGVDAQDDSNTGDGTVSSTDEEVPMPTNDGRAPRVHVLVQYVVIEPEDTDDIGGGVRVSQQPDGELKVERFVRPHWVEPSTQLVRQARENALARILPTSGLSGEVQHMMRVTLLAEGAHMDSISDMVGRVFASEFGSAAERDAFIVQAESEERAEYLALFHRYTGQDSIDASVASGAFAKMSEAQQAVFLKEADVEGRALAREDGMHFALRPATEISNRRAMEVESRDNARSEAEAAGRVYEEAFQQPPPRKTETQTYRVGHVRESSAVQLRQGIGRTPHGTTVVKASSALEAAMRLAGIGSPE